MGFWRNGLAMGLALALAGGAVAQEAAMEGWQLVEREIDGAADLHVSWFEPGGEVVLAFNCQEGFPDLYVTFFMAVPESGPGAGELAFAAGDKSFAMAAGGTEMQGRFAVDALTSFQPELVEMLKGDFSVLVDGVEQGQFSTEGAEDMFARMMAACPAG